MSDDIRRDRPTNPINNMTDGRDDPNRGPLDRAANAMTGTSGGVGAMGSDNMSSRQGTDNMSSRRGTDDLSSGRGTDDLLSRQGSVISAVFDTDDQARQAVSELRSLGISDSSLSLITQKRGTTTTSNADGDVVDEEHTNLLRGILGGGALGAGLGVAALAIPGIGPLVAAGAIAASAAPGAMAIGAAVGAAAGSVNEILKSHGVSDEDAAYYNEPMKGGGVLVTVNPDTASLAAQQIHEVLMRNGGHNAAGARA